IHSRADLGGIAHCGRLGEEGAHNTLNVVPAPGVMLDIDSLGRARRGTLTTSACGVCGRRLIGDLLEKWAPAPSSQRFERRFIAHLTEELSARQPHFER